MDVQLKPLTPAEVELVFEWRNHPDVRKVSANSSPLVWDSHVKWCHSRMEAEEVSVWIAWVGDQPIGYGRFDAASEDSTGQTAFVSICVDQGFRARGAGRKILSQLCAIADARNEKTKEATLKLVAMIHTDNKPSMRLFKLCGFLPDEKRVLAQEGFLFVSRAVDCTCENKETISSTATQDWYGKTGIIENKVCRRCRRMWSVFSRQVSPWLTGWLR